MSTTRFAWISSLCIILGLTFLSCQSQDSQQSESAKKVIKFSDQQWESLWINNAIAMFIVKHGYGYPVESVVVSSPIMMQSLPEGEIDVAMELWRVNFIDWYQSVTSSGKVLDLGPTFEKSIQGWYVPRYVIEGDAERNIEPTAPDLKSVFDLPKYKKLFRDPEDRDKGLFLNCTIGWKCAEQNKVKLHAYGLADDFNTMEPGVAPALDAAIVSAYEKGKPILAYYWEPTWIMGAYDFVQLEEPEYSEECWAEVARVLDNNVPMSDVTEKAGCAFKSSAIHKGIYAGLKERAPEVVTFLEKMNVGTDAVNKAAAYVKTEEVEAEQAALWFFKQYPQKWRSWGPADVVAKVEKAIEQAGK